MIHTSRKSLVRAVILVSVVLTWLGPFTMDAYSPGFPDIARDFGAGDWEVQLTLTACLAGLVLGQFVSAWVADRFGRRGPLIVSLVVFLLATIACALAPSIVFLIVARLFQGGAAAIGVSTSRTLGRDVLERGRLAPFFSQLAAVTSIAPIVGPIAGSALMNVGGSWRWIFAMIGVLGFLILVVVVLRLPETHPDRIDPAWVLEEPSVVGADVKPGAKDAGAPVVARGRLGTLLRQRSILAAVLAVGFGSGAVLTYLAGTSILLQDRYGLTASQYAIVFACNAVGLLVAAQINGRLVRRFPPGLIATCSAAALFLDGLGLIAAFATKAPLGVILGLLAVIVMCVGFLNSNVTAIGMSVNRYSASTASAMLGVAQNAFGALTAPLVGIGAAALVPSQAWLVAGYGLATVISVVVIGGREFRNRLGPSGSPTGDDEVVLVTPSEPASVAFPESTLPAEHGDVPVPVPVPVPVAVSGQAPAPASER